MSLQHATEERSASFACVLFSRLIPSGAQVRRTLFGASYNSGLLRHFAGISGEIVTPE